MYLILFIQEYMNNETVHNIKCLFTNINIIHSGLLNNETVYNAKCLFIGFI